MNCSLLEQVYKDASLGYNSCCKLLECLKGKDNKIIGSVEKIRDEYSSFAKMSRDMLVNSGKTMEDESVITKMMSSMGILKEVLADNSDASIAEMLIQGLVLGEVEMEKRIKTASDDVSKDDLKVAKDFFKFQKSSEKELRKYL